jgi:hypothetical protein
MTPKPWAHPSTNFRCPSGVSWVVESRNIVIIDGCSGRVWTLEYPEAAIWDLLARGRRVERVIPMICAIAAVEEQAAARLVHNVIIEWTEASLLVKV